MCFDNEEKTSFYYDLWRILILFRIKIVFGFYEHLHAIAKRNVILITLQNFRNIVTLPVPTRDVGNWSHLMDERESIVAAQTENPVICRCNRKRGSQKREERENDFSARCCCCL